jgi:hypothetical protein
MGEAGLVLAPATHAGQNRIANPLLPTPTTPRSLRAHAAVPMMHAKTNGGTRIQRSGARSTAPRPLATRSLGSKARMLGWLTRSRTQRRGDAPAAEFSGGECRQPWANPGPRRARLSPAPACCSAPAGGGVAVVTTTPLQAVDAPGTSTGTGRLRLSSASSYLPHPEKARRGARLGMEGLVEIAWSRAWHLEFSAPGAYPAPLRPPPIRRCTTAARTRTSSAASAGGPLG